MHVLHTMSPCCSGMIMCALAQQHMCVLFTCAVGRVNTVAHVFVLRNEKWGTLSDSPLKCTGHSGCVYAVVQCEISGGFDFMMCDGIHMEK